jgi:hypothetical protein
MKKRWILLPIFLFFIVSCGHRPSVKIDTMFQPKHNADYSYQVGPKSPTSSGYTIGIINSKINQVTEKSWIYDSEDQKRFFVPFQMELSNAIEKILINKGNKVSGPFASYQEMTYPERERCSFLIEPTITLDLSFSVDRTEDLDVGGENLEWNYYKKISGTITGSIDMGYVILDPLTNEKLERHKLKTIPISQPLEVLAHGFYVYDSNGKTGQYIFYHLNAVAKHDPSFKSYYSRYYNEDNVTTRMFESLYKEVVPQIDKLISVEEFDHLSNYKKTLEKKKVY